ncbi:MAG TPA: competence/damage-inducible protein A [Candidatus Dormibacteraeota bacterium]|nr:competence/damage-inducible protein A [Candidatus Dormibacteraeota bacterium]
MKRAEIIAVGSELLTPFRLDTNSLFLTEQLNLLGIAVIRKSVVGDVRNELSEAFRLALGHADLVISSGGLGPTEDDLTREALAEATGRRLLPNRQVLARIQERFARMGRAMPPNNERQAMVPEGALILQNAYGTAPGLWLELGAQAVVLLPGPPPELRRIFTDHVRALIEPRTGALRMIHRKLVVAGMPESDLDHRIAPIYGSYREVETTILASPEGIEIHLTSWTEDPAGTGRLLDELAGRIASALGEAVFSTEGETLDEVVARGLRSTGATIAIAESCTGGLVSARLTSIPGSSAFFRGGVVSYSNEMKTAWVHVPPALVELHGAVSAEVAMAMAEGVRLASGATLGLGITGIAGPGGATPAKPVGTVHISLADASGAREQLFRFGGERERIRRLAAQSALDMVRRYLGRARSGGDRA